MIKFGTSGFRGIIADNYTKEAVQKIAYALCEIARKEEIKNPEIVVGYDNRFMSQDFAKWASEVLATTMKVKFYSIPAPTPLISFETKNLDFGLMLTASHNPYNYSGVKVILRGGRDCDNEFAKKIERIANKVKLSEIQTKSFDDAVKEKRITIVDNIKSYCDSILKFVDVKKIQKSNIKVIANSMHGNATASVKYLFDKLKLNYELINENIDPYFEHKLPAPYKNNIEDQAKRVVKEKFDLGVAFDGDGDRFAMISSSGKYYDCNFVGAVLYYYLIKVKNMDCGVSKNYAITSLMYRLAESFGKNCYETVVGFKNIATSLLNTDSLIGVESNGIAFKPHSLIKDGPLVAVLLIDAICALGKSFDEILDDIQRAMNFKSHIVEYNYPITDKQKEKINELVYIQKKTPKIKGRKIKEVNYDDGCKVIYEDGYWAMLRFSGTEPLVRVYAEMKDLKGCNELVGHYEKFLGIKTRQQ